MFQLFPADDIWSWLRWHGCKSPVRLSTSVHLTVPGLLFEAFSIAIFCMLGGLSGAFPSSQTPKQLRKGNSYNLALWSVKFGSQRSVDTGQSHLARKLLSPACSSGLFHYKASAFQMVSSKKKKDLLRYNPSSVQFSLLKWIVNRSLGFCVLAEQGTHYHFRFSVFLTPNRAPSSLSSQPKSPPLAIFYLCLSGHIL